MPGVGVADSAEEAVTLVGFLDPEAGTDFYVAEGFPDYHPEHPGGKPQGGRTLETPLFPGAMLGNMREARWSPVADLPPGVNDMNRVMVDADRTRPRSIMVNRRGRRFTNEAANYNAFGGAFHAPELDDAPTPAAPAHRHLAVYELDGDVDEVMAEFLRRVTSGEMPLDASLDLGLIALSAWHPSGSHRQRQLSAADA
jgi:hypothetical protein